MIRNNALKKYPISTWVFNSPNRRYVPKNILKILFPQSAISYKCRKTKIQGCPIGKWEQKFKRYLFKIKPSTTFCIVDFVFLQIWSRVSIIWCVVIMKLTWKPCASRLGLNVLTSRDRNTNIILILLYKSTVGPEIILNK